MRRPGLALVAVMALLGAACTDDGGGETTADSSATAPPRVADTSAIPPEVLEYAADWPVPGQDYENSRAAVDAAITAANVDELEQAWTVPLTGGASTAPIVVGGTVYVQDTTSVVHAVDRETGAERWTAPIDDFTIGPHGVAVGWGRVYAATSTGVRALDAETGEERWNEDITATETDGVDIQPTVYGGDVLASTVPISVTGLYIGGDRGVIHALDAETGEGHWSFDTVDSEDVWGNDDVNSGGGAWYPPAIDTELGVEYWGVANPAPFPGTPEFPNGSSRPGDNLYTDSVVALDAETGELDWYFQAYPHDLFDRDLVHTMLVDLPASDGDDARRIVVATGKGGDVFGLDQESGELLWETEVGKHENDDLTSLSGPTDVLPGTFGGVITPPASADGVVYVATVNAPTELAPDEPAFIGSEIGTDDGQVVAIDATDGRILWDVTLPGDLFGGATVVNDLVLTTNYEGLLMALDRSSGEIVWEHQLPGGVNSWLSVAGGLVLVPVGIGEPQLVALRLPPG